MDTLDKIIKPRRMKGRGYRGKCDPNLILNFINKLPIEWVEVKAMRISHSLTSTP